MTDMEAVQWFFDLQPVASGFNWPVHVDALVESKRALDALLAEPITHAADVLAAYQKLHGALGPTVMNTLLESDDAFPEVNRSGQPTPPASGKIVLFVDRTGRAVVAETTKQWGMPVTFSII
jgi:hypothetical protein